MVTEVAKNIYKAVVPLPNNPLRDINVYIIKGERNLIIDSGFNRPECEEVLLGALTELGIEQADIFVTHLHSDHCGLVPKLVRPGCKVYASETDGELINFEVGNLYWQILDDLFLRYGFPRAEFGRNTDIHPGRKYVLENRLDFTYVSEDDVLEYGGYKLHPIITPGHTPGMACLYDPDAKIFFCADHILGTITPNISVEICDENPLRSYLESLERVDKLDVDLLLTAHGTPVPDMHERIHELQKHHKDRLAEAESILGDAWKNAYEVARDMTWEIDCRCWDDFPKPQKWFATGEAISHLQYLTSYGRAERKEVNGIYIYRRING